MQTPRQILDESYTKAVLTTEVQLERAMRPGFCLITQARRPIRFSPSYIPLGGI